MEAIFATARRHTDRVATTGVPHVQNGFDLEATAAQLLHTRNARRTDCRWWSARDTKGLPFNSVSYLIYPSLQSLTVISNRNRIPSSHTRLDMIRQRDRLEDLLRHLSPERSKIGDCMIFCIEHADAADEICECIEESLASNQTLISKKIARLYLVSDILHNCTVKVSNASFYRTS